MLDSDYTGTSLIAVLERVSLRDSLPDYRNCSLGLRLLSSGNQARKQKQQTSKGSDNG